MRQLPKLYANNDKIAITIPEDKHMEEIQACKNNLHGRILWPRGARPIKIDAMCL